MPKRTPKKKFRSSLKTYIGIDPGVTGGIAALHVKHGEVSEVVYMSMPRTERDQFEAVKELASHGSIVHACVEAVHSFPHDGGKSAFTFGCGYGRIRMALIGLGIPFEDPLPKEWQGSLKIRAAKKKQRKEKLRAKCQELYPDLPIWSEPRSLGRQRAMCDALLLADYCYKYKEGLLRG